jgi:TusA-related sulfurtransferase
MNDAIQQFLAALAVRDFERVEALFGDGVRFRALVPSGVREGTGASEATGWLRRWFGNADRFELLRSHTDMLADRYLVSYRVRLREEGGWYVVEQQAYLMIDAGDGRIQDVSLLCSGFRPQPGVAQANREQAPQPRFAADAFYDAGARGCAEGPLEEIARQMRQLSSGQQLEVRATATSVAADLPAWCRLAGHELLRQEGHHYLLQRN